VSLVSYIFCLNFKSCRWLDPLRNLIGQVDEKFSRFFRGMGCAGEVSLSEDKDNVSKILMPQLFELPEV